MADEKESEETENVFARIQSDSSLPDKYKELASVLKQVSKEKQEKAKEFTIDDKLRTGVEHIEKGEFNKGMAILKEVVQERGAPEDYSQLGRALVNSVSPIERKYTRNFESAEEGIEYLRKAANERGSQEDHWHLATAIRDTLFCLGYSKTEERRNLCYVALDSLKELDEEFVRKRPLVPGTKAFLEKEKDKSGQRQLAQDEFGCEKVRQVDIDGNQTEYTIVRKIGEGDFFKLAKAENDKGERVAAKFFYVECSRNETKKRFIEAAKKLASLSSKRLAKYYTHEESPEKGIPYITMELFEEPWISLDNVSKPMPLLDAVNLAKNIALSLEELHQNGIIHGCVNTGDVFYNTETCEVKVADAGFSELWRHEPYSDHIELGKKNLPVERNKKDYKPTPKEDVNSLGILLYHIFTGKKGSDHGHGLFTRELFAHSTIKEAMSKAYPYMPKTLETLILSMLDEDPSKRPTVSEVAEKLGTEAHEIGDPFGKIMKGFDSRYRKLERLFAKKSRPYGVVWDEKDAKIIQEKAAELRDYASKMGILRLVESKLEQLENTLEEKTDDNKAEIKYFDLRCRKLEMLLAKKSRKYGVTPPEDAKEIQKKADELRQYAVIKKGIHRDNHVEWEMREIEKAIEKRKNEDLVVIEISRLCDDPKVAERLVSNCGLPAREVNEMENTYKKVGRAWTMYN